MSTIWRLYRAPQTGCDSGAGAGRRAPAPAAAQARQEAGQRQIEALERQPRRAAYPASMELERTREQVAVAQVAVAQVAVAQVQYTAVAGAEARARRKPSAHSWRPPRRAA
ncbi:hypothetical protein ACU4GD_29920 [Cupriavidus basilensis]